MPVTSPAENAAPCRVSVRVRRRTVLGGGVFLCALLGLGLLGGFSAVTNSLASRALGERDLAAAERWLSWSRRLHGNALRTELLEARLDRRRNRLDDMQQHLLAAQRLGADIDLLEREQWLALAQAGQMREADPHLARLLTDPRGDGAEICEAYVTGYLLTYQFARGEAVLAAWAADFPRDLQPRLIRARLSKKNQDWKGAESAYRQVLEVAPASAEAMLGLADVLMTQQRPADALEYYLRIPPGSSETIPARAGAATCLVTLGRVSQAREILSDLLAAHPDQPLGLRALGRVELEAGNYQRATELLRKSQLQEPENDETLYLLAGALRGIGEIDEARRLSSKVKQIREANVEINRLATIVAQEPDNVAARYQIGQLLLSIGMQKEALVWLKSVLQFEPGHTAAREEIERFEPQSKKNGAAPGTRRNRDETAG